jgi:ABC-type sugar transport system ATPase subunit
VYLLDEPLSNVDALLGVRMRNEIARLWKTLGTTVVYVTHDQSEALALGTKICVLHEGRVQQTGTAREIYDAPRNRFVSEFVGTPPINMARGRLRMDRATYFDPWQMPLSLETAADLRSWRGPDIQLAIRPEAITATGDPGSKFAMKGEIEQVEYLGAVTWLSCRVAGELIVARTDGTASEQIGRMCHLIPDRDKLHWFNPETGERL